MSTNTESVVNSLIAACEGGYTPTQIELLSNPSVETYLGPTREMLENILTAYGKTDGSVRVTELDHETDFGDIISHFREPIDDGESTDAVAVDVTPGRKFMSAIAFQVGMKYEAEHVYYLHLDSEDYYGDILSTIPSVAYDLIDFRTLMG